jgi:hypothetical protein
MQSAAASSSIIGQLGIFIVLGVLVVLAWNLWLSYIQTVFLKSLKWTLIEIKPPRDVFKSPAAMELVLNALYAGAQGGDWYTKYWKGEVSLWHSLEIISIEGQVRFFVRTPEKFKKMIEAQIYAQYPQAEVSEVDDYTEKVPAYEKNSPFNIWACNFVLSKDDVYPIKSYVDYGLDKSVGSLDEEQRIDPITPMIEFLGSLNIGEQVWFQILIRPDTKRFSVKGKEGVLEEGKDWKAKAQETIKDLNDKLKEKDKEGKVTAVLRATKAQQGTIEAIERHAAKFGFDSHIRALYIAEKEAFNAGTRAPSLIGSLRQYASSDLNGFKPDKATKIDFPWQDIWGTKIVKMKSKFLRGYKSRGFFYGGFDFKDIKSYFTHPNKDGGKPYILSTEELATIFHLPGRVSETPTFTRIESKKAEPPANLPI